MKQPEARDGFVWSKVEAFSISNNLDQRRETQACGTPSVLSQGQWEKPQVYTFQMPALPISKGAWAD